MEYGLRTSKPQEFIDITSFARECVIRNKIKEGVVVLFVPHTTAGITINENSDPDVLNDMLTSLSRVIPEKGDYSHGEGNSHAHMKASMMGSSCTVIVENGELMLGTWQSIYFCEFDGPRNRKVYVRVMGKV